MPKPLAIVSFMLVVIVVIGGAMFFWLDTDSQQGTNSNKDKTESAASYTKEEVEQHSSENDCWTIIRGNVYNLTSYINRHPGGDEILKACGTDATNLFERRTTDDGKPVGSGSPHSGTAHDQLDELKIGIIKN